MIEDMKDTFFPRFSCLNPRCFNRILAAARALDSIQGDSFRELFLGRITGRTGPFLVRSVPDPTGRAGNHSRTVELILSSYF